MAESAAYGLAMQVRDAESCDAEAIARVHRLAFGGEHGLVVDDLVVDLIEAHRSEAVSLVATEADQVVGHVLFTPGLLDASRELVRIAVLSPLGVLPDFQRRGIGRALALTGIDRLDKRGVPLVILEGDPSYYAPLGFHRAGDVHLRRPSLRIPKDAFQCRQLSTWRPWMTGTVVYSQPFWTHDAVGLRDQL